MNTNVLTAVTVLDGIMVGVSDKVPYTKVLDMLEDAMLSLVNAEAHEDEEDIEKHSIRVLSLADTSSDVLTKSILSKDDICLLVEAFDKLLCVVNSPVNQCIISEEEIEKLKVELFDFLGKTHGLHSNSEILKICISTTSSHLLEGIKNYDAIKNILEDMKK